MVTRPGWSPPRVWIVLTGRLIAESLRVGQDLRVPGLTVARLGRHDVTRSTTPFEGVASDSADRSEGASGTQPNIWTFVDFEAPDERADELAEALARALMRENGWWADFVVGDDHVVVFASKVFRYRIGDADARNAAVDYGVAAGTPRHQLDWGD
jgi:hypothetical protein